MLRSLIILSAIVSVNAVAQTEVYFEDFQSGLPATYTIVDNDGNTPHSSVTDFTDAWIALQDPIDTLDTIVGSTSYFSPAGRADRWLITPPVTLGAFGNILSWDARSHDASYLDGYDVYISVTDTQLSSFTDTLMMVFLENAEWTQREVNLSEAGYNNQTVHFAFVNRTYDGFKLYLDDIRVMIEDPVGVSENEDIQVSMYPNPASDLVKIQSEQNIERVDFYAVDGKLVHSSKLSTISVTNLQPGIYHVVIKTEAGSTTRRLIKE